MRHCRCVSKIIRHASEIQRRGSVYDHQIAGQTSLTVPFAAQNCAGDLCILSRAFAESINRSALQSEVLRRNSERLQVSALRARCNKSFACDRYFIQPVCAVNNPRLFHADKSKRRSELLNERMIPHAQELKRRTRWIR